MKNLHLPVAIIGGGPVGIAAAAHLIERKQAFLLFESGETPGANVRSWAHVRVFSPWKYNIDKAARELLSRHGWLAPDDEILPSGAELYRQYLLPFAGLPEVKPFIHTRSRVISVGRRGIDKMKTAGRNDLPFVLRVLKNGQERTYEARAVIDASGTWQQPNPLGSGGNFARNEQENHSRIFYGIPDIANLQERYRSKSVLVVGGGHSAINTILELEKLREIYPDTKVHWVLRKKNMRDVYGGQEDDALPARGELGIRIEQLIRDERLSVYTPFLIEELVNENAQLTIIGRQGDETFSLAGIDEIIVNTGSRPDYSILRELRTDADAALESVPALAELIDPNIHSCGTVRAHGERELRQKESDLYVVGMKSYGRAPTFLMATGYEQVRSVVAALCGDYDAAARVELDLPETGVCSSGSDGGSCCGKGPAQKSACC